MKPHDNTKSVRIGKELVDKITQISKSKGQTISGYIGVHLSKQVDRDWERYKLKNGETQADNS